MITTARTAGRAMIKLPATLAKACPSSWISWACYWAAVLFIGIDCINADVQSGGLGLLVLGAGMGVFFGSVVSIQRHMRLSLTANTYGSPKHLVTSGPFAYSRNPIYVAFLVPLMSLGYYSLPVAALAVAAYIFAMTILVIRNEEAILEKTFGASYREYMSQVPRWFI